MGYQTPAKTSYVEVYGAYEDLMTITSIATNQTISSITVPNLEGNIIRATAQFQVQQVRDDSGALNYIDGLQFIKIGSDTLCTLGGPGHCLLCPANSIESGNFIFGSAIDIKGYLTPGSAQNVTWALSKSKGDSLYVYGPHITIKCYLE
jgi:hypothetical protein